MTKKLREEAKSVGRGLAFKLEKAGRTGGRPEVITHAVEFLCEGGLAEALDVLRDAAFDRIPEIEKVMYDIDEQVLHFAERDANPHMDEPKMHGKPTFLSDLKECK